MVKAINASILPDGSFTIPKTESAKVILCARVKAVMVFNKFFQPKTINNKPITNKR